MFPTKISEQPGRNWLGVEQVRIFQVQKMMLKNARLWYWGSDLELGVIYFPTSWGTKEPQNLPNHRVECTPSLPTCHSYCQYTSPKAFPGEVGLPPETCELLNVRILQKIERDEGQIPRMMIIPLFIGFQPSQVFLDSFLVKS